MIFWGDLFPARPVVYAGDKHMSKSSECFLLTTRPSSRVWIFCCKLINSTKDGRWDERLNSQKCEEWGGVSRNLEGCWVWMKGSVRGLVTADGQEKKGDLWSWRMASEHVIYYTARYRCNWECCTCN